MYIKTITRTTSGKWKATLHFSKEDFENKSIALKTIISDSLYDLMEEARILIQEYSGDDYQIELRELKFYS